MDERNDTAPRRKRGRPRQVEQGSPVSTWISTDEHDELIRLAAARRQSPCAYLRDKVREGLDRDRRVTC